MYIIKKGDTVTFDGAFGKVLAVTPTVCTVFNFQTGQIKTLATGRCRVAHRTT